MDEPTKRQCRLDHNETIRRSSRERLANLPASQGIPFQVMSPHKPAAPGYCEFCPKLGGYCSVCGGGPIISQPAGVAK